ncbi:sulfite exporter TauE/SafE family protein [Devosia sp. FJ2-5-3]|uniref:sulfite exporter TauE/SafE family protein n=1 Tax=Devosia sp. FJ2-5-3 TaxID=2976680 RepID=UPI0023D7E230|nr:sulfite exporter TauE/SafE family protein [Devosia sp. FJ2-5-3]WEJ57414.1 sulfite exporter TauE/SafE family protein [Devosia sp. FJ2-5-3]
MTEIMLLLAGLIGGAVNSLAGGGSFIVFPALLFAGVPPVLANASNTYAALPGYASGAMGYWKSMAAYKDRLISYGVVAALFGYVGAELLLVVSDEQFSKVVPWLMAFAVALFVFGNQINTMIKARGGERRGMKALGAVLLLGLLAAVCVYGGFFNAGLGILLLAFLAMAGMTDIHAMNGLKLYISSIVALVAVVRFALGGTIDFYHGSIALVGVTIGGYAAARLAKFIPTNWIRTGVIIYGIGMTLYFFWTAYIA